MDTRLHAACQDLREGGRTGYATAVELTEIQHFPATPFDANMVQTVEDSAQRRNYPHQSIVTGAGHDAVYVATVAPTSMIFVPCKDGISHNELEDAKPEHLEAGTNV